MGHDNWAETWQLRCRCSAAGVAWAAPQVPQMCDSLWGVGKLREFQVAVAARTGAVSVCDMASGIAIVTILKCKKEEKEEEISCNRVGWPA